MQNAQKTGLASLSQAILASLGVPSFAPGFNLQPTTTTIVFMIDGLGQQLLDENRSGAPFLNTLLGTGQSFKVGFPATTATSLASFALAQGSGQHGIVGSRFALDAGTAFTPLPWIIDSPYDGNHLLHKLPALSNNQTAWEIVGASGLKIECILPAKISHSHYSKAVYRGATITPYADYEHCRVQIEAVLEKSKQQLIYIYVGELDYAGHIHGTGSEAWLKSLRQIDALISSTANKLVKDTKLLITADHGMTTLSPDLTCDFDSDRHLQEGVAWVAGDIRARHVYVKGENANAVLQRWANKLGDNFTVLSRQQAIAACLFGDSVSAAYEQRLGDLIVYPSGLGGIVKSKTEKHPTSWKAHHGSLTEADQLVPLLNCFNE